MGDRELDRTVSPGLVHSPDIEVQQMLTDLRNSGAKPFAELGVDEIRARMAGLRETMPPSPEVFAVEDLSLPSAGGPIPVRRFQPRSGPIDKAVLHFHGGGWVGGSVALSDGLCRRLALASGTTVFSVDYRLAPEHPFPAAIQDADAALAWLLERPEIERVVLAGDSAGGTLATVACRHAVERGAAAPIVLEVLIYPVTDGAMETGSYARNTEGLILNAGDMRKFWDLYLPDVDRRASPDASPLRAENLAGMPPTYFLVAELDPLRDEGLAYANRLREAGVDVVVDEYDGLIHGFFPLAGMLTAADRAVDAVAAVISAAVTGERV